MIDREPMNKFPEKDGWFKTFFKRLFCQHNYLIPDKDNHPDTCWLIVICPKCEKRKRVTVHDYKVIKRTEVSECGVSGIHREYIRKVYECSKCGDIMSRDYYI